MNWESIYLTAFLIGFLFSALTFVLGFLNTGHFHLHGHHGGHFHAGAKGLATKGGGVSPFNFATGAAFLAWFGGTGYLLERYSGFVTLLVLGASIVSGLGAGAVVFWFLVKLSADEKPLDPADYEMVGVLGKVASAIRCEGTGEIFYMRDGARKAAAARSEEGREIPRDTEVVVTRYEKGVAYVRRWDEMSGER
jgi:membrane protein implicated in regulation of membrane protease activity